MTHRSRMQSMLWGAGLAIAAALCLALMLQVKAVKSDIADTDREIVAMKQELIALDTEFQTRARQQQLVRWNEVDFGYEAPRANQFIEGRRALAALGVPVVIEEPTPVRLAEAEVPVDPSPTAVMPSAGHDAPTRLAVASSSVPAMLLQLVAHDDVRREVVVTRRAEAARDRFGSVQVDVPVASRSPAGFAEHFDLDSVIAGSGAGL